MKKETWNGMVWETESPVFRYIDPFIEMVDKLREYKHIYREDFVARYKLTDEEFNSLVGRAEEYANTNPVSDEYCKRTKTWLKVMGYKNLAEVRKELQS